MWNEQGRFCGHTDIPLSTLGRKQARKLALYLQYRPITVVYSSDLSRARETAEIIVKKLTFSESRETLAASLLSSPPSVIVSPAWREIHFGAWEGLTYDEIATSFHEQRGFFTNPEYFAPPQGETITEVLQRVMPALHDIMKREQNGEVVLVSHGGTLRGLLCSLLGMPLHNQWQLRVDTGSLSAIDVSLGEHGELLASLVGLNITSL